MGRLSANGPLDTTPPIYTARLLVVTLYLIVILFLFLVALHSFVVLRLWFCGVVIILVSVVIFGLSAVW